MKKALLIFSLCLAFGVAIIRLQDKEFVFTVLRYNLPDVNDYQKFSNRAIPKSRKPQPWPLKSQYNLRTLPDSTNARLLELNTIACVIIHNDSLLFEKSWQDPPERYSNSFSMAKSYVSALIGVALREGRIKSLDDAVGEYLRDFKEGNKSAITIRHLLSMSSGLDWEESYYNPFSTVSEAYYGNELKHLIKNLKPIENPGKKFEYKGGDTQILAFILEEVYGQQLSKILYDKIWNPLGAENPALWSLDHKGGVEKASCCLNSNAKDFARLGSLYLNKGNWKGVQIIDTGYIAKSIQPLNSLDIMNNKVDYYGYQWWLIPSYKNGSIYYARGILGQYIIVDPAFNLVIVRLGHERGEKIGRHHDEVYFLIEAARDMVTR